MPIFQRRLIELGLWLNINGEAIYDTSPWFYQKDSANGDVWYTCKKELYDPVHTSSKPNRNDVILAVYAIFLYWPNSDLLLVKDLVDYVKEDYTSRVVLLSIEALVPVNVSVYTCLTVKFKKSLLLCPSSDQV